MTPPDACDDCLRRTDLIAGLVGRIELEWRLRRGRPRLLGLTDAALLDWAGEPAAYGRYAGFDPAGARRRIADAGLVAVCRCRSGYPEGLRELPDPPAVLHVLGRLSGAESVGIVGARQASPYGLEVARSLGRGLAAAGVVVTSGMALGVDSAAHAGALEAGTTVAVLAGGADIPYPASKRLLHRRIAETGAVVAELPPGTRAHRWCFPARNRIIAALSTATVVVEGGERSGSLITADFANELGRTVGAVPGPVTARLAGGPNLLIKTGAELVRDAADVLDLLYGAGTHRTDGPPLVIGSQSTPAPAMRGLVPDRPEPPLLEPRLQAALDAVEQGRGSAAEIARSPAEAMAAATALGELELLGLVRRTFGGAYIRTAR
jgi:DNA processing protein